MDWLEKMNNAMDYIESNLADEILYDKAAHNACCSTYHFLRMFPFITNVSLAEYIRLRRLTLAGSELQTTDVKVVDVALKYGYESPESFSRAFKNFHGVTPISARDKGIALKIYPRMTFQNNLKILEDFMEKAENGSGAEITRTYKQIEMELVRIYEMPDCKMVSSGIGMFGEENFTNFHKWFTSLPRTMFPRDFLFEDGGKLHWVYMYENGINVPDEFEIIDFKGGLYAVCTDIDQKTNMEAMNKVRDDFLALHGFEIDVSRPQLGNIITYPLASKILGYDQMDYYTPVKPKSI